MNFYYSFSYYFLTKLLIFLYADFLFSWHYFFKKFIVKLLGDHGRPSVPHGQLSCYLLFHGNSSPTVGSTVDNHLFVLSLSPSTILFSSQPPEFNLFDSSLSTLSSQIIFCFILSQHEVKSQAKSLQKAS